MSNQRPFEVGDMVVSNKHGIGNVEEFNAHYKYVVCRFEKKRIEFSVRGFETPEDDMYTVDEHKTEWLNSKITAIRNPRKGSAEARAIVVVSACYYRAKLNKRFRHLVMLGYTKADCYSFAKEYAQNGVEFDIYDEQKSMLK